MNQNQSGAIKPLAEMLAVLFFALVTEWAILPFTRNPFILAIPICACFVIIFYSHRAHSESLPDLGLRVDNFWQCLKLLLLPMLSALLLFILIGWYFGSLRLNELFGWLMLKKYIWLFVWGLIQQYALQAFFNRRAQEVWGKGVLSVFIVALIFAVLHLPNFWLVIATFCGGILWATVYQRAPNLFALAFSHGLMSMILATTIPPAALHGLRVGYNYFRL